MDPSKEHQRSLTRGSLMIINRHTLLYDVTQRAFKDHVFHSALDVYLECGELVIIVVEKVSFFSTVVCRHGIVNVPYDALLPNA